MRPAVPGSRRPPWSVVALVAVVMAAFVVQARAWAFLCDDAFISFRYAINLARDGALVFNVGERVEGYTNFLWVVGLALGDTLGVEPTALAPWLTRAGAAVVLVGCVRLVRAAKDGPHRHPLGALDLVPALLGVASPELMVWSGGGLETAMAAGLVLLTMTAVLEHRLVGGAVWGAAACLCRPDALLPIAVAGAAWIALTGSGRIPRPAWSDARVRHRAVVALLVFAIPLLVHLIWRRSYYGAWLPNTFAVKSGGAELRHPWGDAYLLAWVRSTHLAWLAPLAIFIRWRHGVVVLPLVAVAAYAWAVGGDFMAYSRLLMPATALLTVLAGWLVSEVASRLDTRGSRRLGSPVAVGAILIATLAIAADARARWQLDRETASGWLDKRWEGVTAMHRFAMVGLAVGRWMATHLPADTLISVGAAGAVPYGSRLAIVDAYGLVDPDLASLPEARIRPLRARPGHQLWAPPSYMKARDPDLLCHVGWRGPASAAPRRSLGAFARGYVWACIEPAPARGVGLGPPIEPGKYCCRRPRDRIVGQFGRREPL